ncbi:uncharacterized protein BX663DRAFT_549927 [Cokeromyces recurvatus]|uniref:uncharacterized protein n=1 Tax=Cokeromyces recurvatus TaxID=90255 RepID=UPI0022210D9F|nr:uncharacterized protein BX663DRAFT_549927 [Cokeromyces recurvatus]KAI7905079.1 hypothetical protein BX663DRAFT_549927 [Cokeromyces recurvatus]
MSEQVRANEHTETAQIGNESASKFTEQKMRECFKSIYESTRIASEIHVLENKLNSLTGIRQKLCSSNDNKPLAGLNTMNSTINDLEMEIKQKENDMRKAENYIISSCQQICDNVLEASKKNALTISNMTQSFLETFSKSVYEKIDNKISSTQKIIEIIQKEKMDVAEKENMLQSLEAFKTQLKDVQKNTLRSMGTMLTSRFKELSDTFDKKREELNAERLKNEVQNKIMSILDDKFKKFLEEAKKQNEMASAKESDILVPDQVLQIVKKEIMEQVGPTNLQKIITSLPEYQALKEMQQELTFSEGKQSIPADLEAVKQRIQELTSEIIDLKQVFNSTRVILDTFKNQNVSSTHNDPNITALTSFDQTAALKRMEDVLKEISLIHNNIKMIETVVSVKAKAVEDNHHLQPRKRQRIDDITEDTDETSNAAILARLVDIETKHQKLLDFILQRKDTVLDDMFPTRLEAAMKKIEKVLLNHETFISYLIDPFTTSKKLQMTSIPTNTNLESSTLNPALLDAISQLIKQKAEEIALPLHQKIKSLEEKLEQRK